MKPGLRTVNVPLRAGANHFGKSSYMISDCVEFTVTVIDLPKELHTGLSRHENARTKYKGKTQDVRIQTYQLILRQPSISGWMQTCSSRLH